MSEARKNLADLVLVVGGKLASIGVVFVGGAIMARWGGPVEYGLFATGIAAVLLMDGMIGSPLDIGANRFSALHPGDEARTRRFEAMSVQVKLLVLVLVMGAWTFWSMGNSSESVGGNVLIAVVVAGLLAARSTATGLQIRQQFKAYSMVDLVQGGVRIAAFVSLAAIGFCESDAFLLAYGAVSLLVVGVGLGYFRQTYLLGAWPERADVKRMFGYCGFAAGVVSLGTLTGRGDLLLLSSWFSPEEVANYGIASQLFLLLAQLSLYISVVTQPRVLGWAREGRLRTLFLLNAAVIGVAALPVLLFFFNPGWLDFLITLVFGAGYEGATEPFRILMLGGLIDLLLVPILMIFILQVRPGLAFVGEVLATMGFVLVALLVIPRTEIGASQVAMAWLAVGVRGFKLVFYLVLFSRVSLAEGLPEGVQD